MMINAQHDLADIVLNSIGFPLLVIDTQNQVIEANTSAEAFFQSGRKTLLDQSIDDLFPSSSPVNTMIDKARITAANVNDQGIDISSNLLGNRLINLHISPLVERSGLVAILIQERALAERLRGQEQFRGSSRRMSSFAALLAHEIKTPLSAIRGAAELITRANTDSKQNQLANLIVSESDRVTELVNRMETLAAGNTINRKSINIHEIIDHCIALAEQSFGNGFTFEKLYDPSLPDTFGDKELLIQALINLLKNACEASDINDKITVKTVYNLGSRLTISAADSDHLSMLGVVVINHGDGIPDAIKTRLFDPFVTAKPDGTGLGLALVASIVTDHGGSVDVSDDDGKTMFQINLPITRGMS